MTHTREPPFFACLENCQDFRQMNSFQKWGPDTTLKAGHIPKSQMSRNLKLLKMKELKFITIITSLSLLFACSNMPSGSEYLGTWKDDKWGDDIKISKQGEAFLLEGDIGMSGIYILTEENFLKSDFGFIAITAYIEKDTKKLVVSHYGSERGISKWTKVSSN